MIKVNRAVLGHRVLTGISRRHLAELTVELASPWQAEVEGRRHAARSGTRQRAAGAGAKHRLVFVDRLTATLADLVLPTQRPEYPVASLDLAWPNRVCRPSRPSCARAPPAARRNRPHPTPCAHRRTGLRLV